MLNGQKAYWMTMLVNIDAARILIIRYRMIGDVLLDTPIIRALRHHYPHSHIAFCTEATPAGVLRGNPDLDEILYHPRPATWYQELQFIRQVRRRRFDLVLDLMGNSRSALLTRLSGARHRLAFARFPRALCYSNLVDHQPEVEGYTVIKRLRLLEPLGIQATDISLQMTYTQQERETVEHFLSTHQIKPDDLLICIDPTSYVATREWPGEHFARLIDLLSKRLNARVCLLWGPGEKEKVEAIAAAAQTAPLLHPAWDLAHVAALLARADLLIGCNSAPLHIAVSQHTPTLTIHGATGPSGWSPPDPQHRTIALGLPCQPCGKRACGPPLNIDCLRSLSPEAVYAAVETFSPFLPAGGRPGWRETGGRET
jgi:ADP-heptose:LPS heptosyltransferase